MRQGSENQNWNESRRGKFIKTPLAFQVDTRQLTTKGRVAQMVSYGRRGRRGRACPAQHFDLLGRSKQRPYIFSLNLVWATGPLVVS